MDRASVRREAPECRGRYGNLPILVEALAAAGKVGDQGIDEHVGWAGIEGEDLRGLGGGGEDGDVGNAAEIQGNAAEFRVAVEQIVGVGDERGALAA